MLALSITAIPAQPQTSLAPLPISRAALSLPDSPGYVASVEDLGTSTASGASSEDQDSATPALEVNPSTPTTAPINQYWINSNQTAQRLTTNQKIVLVLKHSVSAYAVSGWFLTSGASQLLNATPNYGVDSGAYGERLGAAVIRGVTSNIFSGAVFASLLHEDPRYYRMGRANGNVGRRILYAERNVLMTRTDDGKPRLNFHMFFGNLCAAALTPTYYPDRNKNAKDVFKTYGESFVGAGLGFVAAEFLDDALTIVHLKRHE